jgi:hypothetical protein
MTRRSGIVSLLAMVAGLAVAPNGAGAATTIGSNLAASDNGTGHGCVFVLCTDSYSTLPIASQAPGGLLAPEDGVVVRWRIKAGSTSGSAALRITRPGNSDTRTGAGTGPTENPPANTTSTFDVRLPIKAGDAIGIDCCIYPTSWGGAFYASTPSATTLDWNPRLEEGAPARLGGSAGNFELLINADIEPDADCDGLGDETQDSMITTTCPVIPLASTPQATPQATGQPAAALKKCKKNAKKKDWSQKKLKKCKKKAKRLPVY